MPPRLSEGKMKDVAATLHAEAKGKVATCKADAAAFYKPFEGPFENCLGVVKVSLKAFQRFFDGCFRGFPKVFWTHFNGLFRYLLNVF